MLGGVGMFRVLCVQTWGGGDTPLDYSGSQVGVL